MGREILLFTTYFEHAVGFRSDINDNPSPAESEGTKGNRSRNSSPAMSRKSSVVSWSDSPREQLEANVLPREQSASFGDVVKVAVLEDASGPGSPESRQ